MKGNKLSENMRAKKVKLWALSWAQADGVILFRTKKEAILFSQAVKIEQKAVNTMSVSVTSVWATVEIRDALVTAFPEDYI